MATKKVKGKKYKPHIALEGESINSDLIEATKYYRAVANMQGGGTSYRNNISYRGQSFDRFGALQNNFLTPKQSIALAQLCYADFCDVKHAIDTMAEFTVSGIDFISNKKASREAMLGWAQAIGLKSFLDQVALEYYRSGNVYIYRFESTVKSANLQTLNSLLGVKGSIKIPTRYTILDPKLVDFVNNGLFDTRAYQVVIPASEAKIIIENYKNNKDQMTDLPIEFVTAIEAILGKNAKKGQYGDLVIRLNPENMIVLYRKKQPYEAYALPFLSGTFDDLEFRKELRNMDKAVARVVSRILIHVAVGDAEHMPSPAALDAIRDKLANPSTNTYLITDGAVKIEQYYPDVSKMLDPTKYEAVTKDILRSLGISSAASGASEGSFSSNFLGIKILVERIVDGRTKILQEFLMPEVRRVSKSFNLKAEVTPKIIGVELTDEKEWAKIYTRLYEDGLLSPQSAIESIGDNRFPTWEEELQRQEESKAQLADGLFQPHLNRGGNSQDSGRPQDTKNPPQSKPVNTAPKGSNAVVIRNVTQESLDTAKSFASKYVKAKHNIKKLTQEQTKFIDSACNEFLISNDYSEDSFTNFLNNLFGNS